MLFFMGAILCLPYHSLLQSRLRLQINLDFISNFQENVKEILEQNRYGKILEVFERPHPSTTPEAFSNVLDSACSHYNSN